MHNCAANTNSTNVVARRRYFIPIQVSYVQYVLEPLAKISRSSPIFRLGRGPCPRCCPDSYRAGTGSLSLPENLLASVSSLISCNQLLNLSGFLSGPMVIDLSLLRSGLRHLRLG